MLYGPTDLDALGQDSWRLTLHARRAMGRNKEALIETAAVVRGADDLTILELGGYGCRCRLLSSLEGISLGVTAAEALEQPASPLLGERAGDPRG